MREENQIRRRESNGILRQRARSQGTEGSGNARKRRTSDESNEGTLRPWTPTSAVCTDQWGSHPSSLIGGSEEKIRAEPVHQGSVMSSRRSSLKSTSVLELEGIQRTDSPGPTFTEDPFEGRPGISDEGSSHS